MKEILFRTADGLSCIEKKGVTDITPKIKRIVKKCMRGAVALEALPELRTEALCREYEYRGQIGEIYVYEEV